MWSAGTHLVVRLGEILAILFAVPLVWLYMQYGLLGALAAFGTYVLSLLGLFSTVWDKLNKPLTERLNYLNQHAFSPLVAWCNSLLGWRAAQRSEVASEALVALQSHRRYLTIGLYPRKLLKLTDEIVQNIAEYEKLENDLLQANNEWIQSHLDDWAHITTRADLGAVLSVLELEQPNYQVRSDLAKLAGEFLKAYKEKGPQQVDRFVFLYKFFREKGSAVLACLNTYMRTNMLDKLTADRGVF